MNVKIIAFVIVAFCIVTTGRAEISQHNVGKPQNAWEHLSPDIDASVDLTVRAEKGAITNVLKIYVKNVSQSIKLYSVAGKDDGAQIIYLDANAKPIPLHNEDLQLIERVYQLEIKPGETICITIPISKEELQLLISHPVKFVIIVIDPVTKKFFKLESTPRVLTRTTSK